MGKSPGKWIKSKIFGKKSSKSNLSKDSTLEKKTSINSKSPSKDFDDDSMVISSPVPPVIHEHKELEKTSSVNLTNDTTEVARSTTGLNTSNENELINLEQAAIKAQTAFRGYSARREFQALKAIILVQAHIRGHLVRKRIKPQVHTPNPEGNSVISTKSENPNPSLRETSIHQPQESQSELEKVKLTLRKISVLSTSITSKPEPEPEPEPEPPLVEKLHDDDDNHHHHDHHDAEIEVVELNGKENQKTRRKSLPSYMAATESAKAKLRAQAAAKAAEDGGENGFTRRHSLPSSTGKLSLQSPRVQKPLQANGKGWSKSNKNQICVKDDKMTGWKR